MAVEFDSHENDHSHENKFSWGYLNTLTKIADFHDGVWSTHENTFSWRDLHHSHENEFVFHSRKIDPLKKYLVSDSVYGKYTYISTCIDLPY